MEGEGGGGVIDCSGWCKQIGGVIIKGYWTDLYKSYSDVIIGLDTLVSDAI